MKYTRVYFYNRLLLMKNNSIKNSNHRWNGIIKIDKNFKIKEFSKGAEEILGYSREEVIGQKCNEVLKLNMCNGKCPIKKILEQKNRELNFVGEINTSTHQKIFLCFNVTPLKNSGKEVEGIVLKFWKIDQVCKIINELFTENLKLNTILNCIADGVFTIDKEGKITSFNKAAEIITGYKEKEVIGKSCKIIFRSECCGDCCPLKQAMKKGKTFSDFEMEILNSKGEIIPVSVSVAPIKDEKGKIIGGVETFRDISALKNLQRKLEEEKFGNLIGKSKEMKKIFRIIESVSNASSTVLIEGETGTGKNLVAEAIHYYSDRRDKPFIKVSCAAVPETLLESELFGYKRGAFTGAIKDKPGKFQLANGGTIFLDEISDLPLSLQAKLLRIIEEQEFEPLGGTETIKVNVRIIAATNTNLEKAMREGKFREDLYYRLNVIKISLPPLRKRKEDIPLLVKHFIEKFNKETGKNIKGVSPSVMDLFMEYDWPGNVRQLENAIEHAFIYSTGRTIQLHHLPPDIRKYKRDTIREIFSSKKPFREMEKRIIFEALENANWNRDKAAKILGISRITLWRKIKKYNLLKP